VLKKNVLLLSMLKTVVLRNSFVGHFLWDHFFSILWWMLTF